MGAVEHDGDAASTFETNFNVNVIRGDMIGINPNSLSMADVLVGGPPCQGFSRLGGMSRKQEHDLNGLWEHYARLIEHMRPKAFLLENVPAFRSGPEYASLVSRIAQPNGEYTLTTEVLDASDFGVAQARRRVFVVGIRGHISDALPRPNGTKKPTVEQKIRKLPAPSRQSLEFGPKTVRSGLDLHFLRNPTELSLKRYSLIPLGGNRFDLMRRAPEITPKCWLNKPSGSTDVFGRLHWDRPSVTIRTEFFKPEKGRYLHPEENRPITHLEAALLQGFPEDYKWVGSKTSVARQIGNAVPPPLAQAIARHLRSLLERHFPVVTSERPYTVHDVNLVTAQ